MWSCNKNEEGKVTDAQYITFILGFAATIAAILIALLINNARLNDAKVLRPG